MWAGGYMENLFTFCHVFVNQKPALKKKTLKRQVFFVFVCVCVCVFWYLFIFDCAESVVECRLSPAVWAGTILCCSVQPSHCGGLSYSGAQAWGAWASVVVAHGLNCLEACGIGLNPCTLDWTGVPCIARWILNYWTTRETHLFFFSPCSGTHTLAKYHRDIEMAVRA